MEIDVNCKRKEAAHAKTRICHAHEKPKGNPYFSSLSVGKKNCDEKLLQILESIEEWTGSFPGPTFHQGEMQADNRREPFCFNRKP